MRNPPDKKLKQRIMTATIVAILNANLYHSFNMTDKEMIKETKQNGTILSLKEFQEAYNADEIDFHTTYIRFIEAELEVKAGN